MNGLYGLACILVVMTSLRGTDEKDGPNFYTCDSGTCRPLEEVLDEERPASCDAVRKYHAKTWNRTGGLFNIYPDNDQTSVEVFCDLNTNGGRWTVFQRRMDGSVEFYRPWDDYVKGFGDRDKEFWLGLETMYQLSKCGDYELRVDMEDWDGNTAYAEYTTFSIGDRASKYRLTVGGYSGTAGDSLAKQNGQMFSAYDSDNDKNPGFNCAVAYKGAWWYELCHNSNLNGLYVQGGDTTLYAAAVVWYHWKGHYYSLKFTEMKFRKRE